ncbi:MAG: PDZ domain-containing protein [Planctomycetaceae bacterium]
MDRIPIDSPPHFYRPRIPVMFWLVLACVFLIGVAIVLMLWVPGLQRRRALQEIAALGGTVYEESPHGPFGGRMINQLSGSNRRVVGIDLTSARLNDESVNVLLTFPTVEYLSLSGPDLTDAGILQLKDFSALRRLVLVNCPRVTETAEKDLQAAIPGLQITRRGPALLGVSGGAGPVGCRVESVRPGTAASRGGLVAGDQVLSIGGNRVRSFESLAQEIGRHQPGDVVTVTVLRRGRRMKLAVTLGSWTNERRR